MSPQYLVTKHCDRTQTAWHKITHRLVTNSAKQWFHTRQDTNRFSKNDKNVFSLWRHNLIDRHFCHTRFRPVTVLFATRHYWRHTRNSTRALFCVLVTKVSRYFGETKLVICDQTSLAALVTLGSQITCFVSTTVETWDTKTQKFALVGFLTGIPWVSGEFLELSSRSWVGRNFQALGVGQTDLHIQQITTTHNLTRNITYSYLTSWLS